jgi:hypothetical protein
MRNFQTLDRYHIDNSTGIITLSVEAASETQPRVAMRREGSYVAISASYGPLEIAMRPRFSEFGHALLRLRPVQGLQTTRQVGTGQAYLAVGLLENGSLVMRPTIVADATGHLCFNLLLTDSVRQAVYDWLPVSEAENSLTI